ncbi:hypothetical protein AVEN_158500-1 [Araneus ventricosus]|uniref:Uncharacterized protein n=1 Tax=Araneus ventricosus TaxID=182803 RepID=A0A4Y2R0M2_ARAVE|nr:hypothetical protein AVEN_158500-1 [Araneus ventricosus]
MRQWQLILLRRIQAVLQDHDSSSGGHFESRNSVERELSLIGTFAPTLRNGAECQICRARKDANRRRKVSDWMISAESFRSNADPYPFT